MNTPAFWTPLLLKLLRQKLRLHGRELAALLGTNTEYYYKVERGYIHMREHWIPILNELLQREPRLEPKQVRQLRIQSGYRLQHMASLLGLTVYEYRYYETQGYMALDLEDKFKQIVSTDVAWTPQKLKRVRKQFKLTQKEAAQLVGIDHSTWSKWESNEMGFDKLKLKENLPSEWIERMNKLYKRSTN